jgi:hypothetical protein
VDRSRVLDNLVPALVSEALALAQDELVLISRRIRLIYAAIVLAVTCALLVCLLIAVAFIDAFMTLNLAKLMGALFVLAMFALIASLAAFLREIFLAVDSARQSMRRRTDEM